MRISFNKMKKISTLFILLLPFISYGKKSCKALIDSLKMTADTSYTRPYQRNKDFFTAEYYINRKDSIVSQLMKDSIENIRQVIIAKKDNQRIYFATYYANGQLESIYHFDSSGRYNGLASFYFQNGAIIHQA